jgi:hypothetical protein
MSIYLALLAGPYWLVLVRYIPHAGYYCLLLPAIVLLPGCFCSRRKSLFARHAFGVGGSFLIISVCQWFLLSPSP